MDYKNIIGLMISFSCGCMIGAACCGMYYDREILLREIDRGDAHYEVDAKTGETKLIRTIYGRQVK